MLTIQIEQVERGITFQVHNQTDKITDYVESHVGFRASNGWRIDIANCPEVDIKAKTIYLQGHDRARDLRVSRNWDLVSNYNRDKYISQVNSALADLAHAVKWAEPQWTPTQYQTMRASQYRALKAWRCYCNSVPSRFDNVQVMYVN